MWKELFLCLPLWGYGLHGVILITSGTADSSASRGEKCNCTSMML